MEKSIRQADVKAVLAKLQSDLEVLAARLPQDAQTALKNAKDVKYIRDRQRIPSLAFNNMLLGSLELVVN